MLCASSPTTSTFPCGAAMASTISPCSRLVSWYSSTSTAKNRRLMLSRAAGTSTSSRFQLSNRSSKSIAFICALRSANLRATRRISSSRATNCGDSRAITSARGRWVLIALEQPESVGVSQPRRVLAQEPVGHVVERPAPHPPRLDPADLADARHHLPGGLVGEREQQELLGRRAGLDQARDAVRERPRLARAGAGDDQGGARIAERDGALLVGEIAVVVDQSPALRRC